MGRRFTKFVGDKFVREGFAEAEGIGFPGCLLGDESTLFAGGV